LNKIKKDAFKSVDKSKSKRVKELSVEKLITRHGGILGVCAIVNASPYDVPDYLPGLVEHLCHFTNDPAPIKVEQKFRLNSIYNLC